VAQAGRPLDPAGDAPPRFGRYRLLKRIGKGGMAEIFLAVMEGPSGFRRRCVVKRIRPDKAKSGYFSQMFIDEARITAALNHPNVVQVWEFGEIGDLYFLTMEFLDGKNLATVLDSLSAKQQRMSIPMATHIARQIARGLHHAHTVKDDDGRPLSVIHRDMSPTNVMLLRTGDVKVLDFGVAQADATLKEGDTVAGRVKGKLSYMSPEQHAGRQVDARSDLFALGVILWEMLTGEVMFSGENNAQRSRLVLTGEATAPSEFRPELPRVLDEIVLRCLAPMPTGRFPSAAALEEALGEVLQSHPFDIAELARLVDMVASEPDLTASAEGPAFADAERITPRISRDVLSAPDITADLTTYERRPRKPLHPHPEVVEISRVGPRPPVGVAPLAPPTPPPLATLEVDPSALDEADLTPVLEMAPPRRGRLWFIAAGAAVGVAIGAMFVFTPQSGPPPPPKPQVAEEALSPSRPAPPPAPVAAVAPPVEEPPAQVRPPRRHRPGARGSRTHRTSTARRNSARHGTP
jgi:serine/threonine protein kinase